MKIIWILAAALAFMPVSSMSAETEIETCKSPPEFDRSLGGVIQETLYSVSARHCISRGSGRSSLRASGGVSSSSTLIDVKPWERFPIPKHLCGYFRNNVQRVLFGVDGTGRLNHTWGTPFHEARDVCWKASEIRTEDEAKELLPVFLAAYNKVKAYTDRWDQPERIPVQHPRLAEGTVYLHRPGSNTTEFILKHGLDVLIKAMRLEEMPEEYWAEAAADQLTFTCSRLSSLAIRNYGPLEQKNRRKPISPAGIATHSASAACMALVEAKSADEVRLALKEFYEAREHAVPLLKEEASAKWVREEAAKAKPWRR